MKSKDQSVHVVSKVRVDRSTPKNEVKRKRFVERIAELLQSVSELDSGKDINDVINLEPQESHGFKCNSATANLIYQNPDHLMVTRNTHIMTYPLVNRELTVKFCVLNATLTWQTKLNHPIAKTLFAHVIKGLDVD